MAAVGEEKPRVEHVERLEAVVSAPGVDDSDIADEKDVAARTERTAGEAIVAQQTAIPLTGERIPTTRLEYIVFAIFYFQNNGTPIGSQAGPLRQKLLSMAFPDSNKKAIIPWGGTHMYLNSFILDSSGILFAVTLVVMLVVGPYADYGTWRPYILMFGTTLCSAMTFGLIGVYKPSQWELANGLWIVGQLGYNISVSFYQATFPSIARNLPAVLRSEADVRAGLKTPEEHDLVDQYERAKLYNICNIVGSALVVVFYGAAIGISYAITHNSTADNVVIKAYRVLLGYFGGAIVVCCLPFFIIGKHRPGQQVPDGVPIWQVGPRQAWSAAKAVVNLRNAVWYLIAYALLGEASGTAGGITGTLQANVINFDPVQNSAFGLLADVAGGLGTVFILFMHKRFKFSIKTLTRYGAIMTLIPQLWGAIGTWTNKIGFHNSWEFWVIQCWNFQTAAWGSYSITMISEVVPAPKMYLFFALFATINRTSGFTGPFISSAINERAHGNTNAAYWFCLGLGLLGIVFVWMVDPDQAKIENAKYLEREANEFYSEEQRQRQQETLDHELNETGVATAEKDAEKASHLS